jgi:hypothetical protein
VVSNPIRRHRHLRTVLPDWFCLFIYLWVLTFPL